MHRLPDSLPDCQASLQNKIITFCWLHNAEVSVTMLSGDSIHLAPEKFRTIIHTEEPMIDSAWQMQTVANKMIICLPWFGGKLTITRTRPIDDQLAKIGFGGII